MTAVKLTSPSLRPRRIALVATIAYAIAYVVALWAVQSSAPDALKFALSILAVAAFALCLLAEVRMARQLDELQQRMQLEALAFAFPLSVGVIMLLGLVERFRPLPVDDLSYRHVWPVMIIFYFIGLALAQRRY